MKPSESRVAGAADGPTGVRAPARPRKGTRWSPHAHRCGQTRWAGRSTGSPLSADRIAVPRRLRLPPVVAGCHSPGPIRSAPASSIVSLSSPFEPSDRISHDSRTNRRITSPANSTRSGTTAIHISSGARARGRQMRTSCATPEQGDDLSEGGRVPVAVQPKGGEPRDVASRTGGMTRAPLGQFSV